MAPNRAGSHQSRKVKPPEKNAGESSKVVSAKTHADAAERRWQIAGEWEHQHSRLDKLRFDPEGTINGGPALWFVHGRQLVLFSPDKGAPGGGSIDYCTLAADERSYEGRNQNGVKVTGKKLKDQISDSRVLPALHPPDVVGSWLFSIVTKKNLGEKGVLTQTTDQAEIAFMSDGTTNQPQGRWFVNGNTLLLVQAADKWKEGFWADILLLVPTRKAASGRNLADQTVYLHNKKALDEQIARTLEDAKKAQEARKKGGGGPDTTMPTLIPLDIKGAATVSSARIFDQTPEAKLGRSLPFPKWGSQTYHDIPFTLIDPEGGKIKNTICLYAARGTISRRCHRVCLWRAVRERSRFISSERPHGAILGRRKERSLW
jgi:hypothetical protein